MFKNVTRLEHKIGERVYHFFCDQDSPVVEVKEAFYKWLGFAEQIERSASETAKAEIEKIKETTQEEPKPE
jgi:hypothetical protein